MGTRCFGENCTPQRGSRHPLPSRPLVFRSVAAVEDRKARVAILPEGRPALPWHFAVFSGSLSSVPLISPLGSELSRGATPSLTAASLHVASEQFQQGLQMHESLSAQPSRLPQAHAADPSFANQLKYHPAPQPRPWADLPWPGDFDKFRNAENTLFAGVAITVASATWPPRAQFLETSTSMGDMKAFDERLSYALHFAQQMWATHGLFSGVANARESIRS